MSTPTLVPLETFAAMSARAQRTTSVSSSRYVYRFPEKTRASRSAYRCVAQRKLLPRVKSPSARGRSIVLSGCASSIARPGRLHPADLSLGTTVASIPSQLEKGPLRSTVGRKVCSNSSKARSSLHIPSMTTSRSISGFDTRPTRPPPAHTIRPFSHEDSVLAK